MKQHTPGPWVFGYSDGSGQEFSTGDNINCPIMGVCQYKHTMGVSITSGKKTVVMGGHAGIMAPQEVGVLKEADARLIAAAPELLGACKSALRALKDNLAPGPMDVDAIEGIEAAIAKATQ